MKITASVVLESMIIGLISASVGWVAYDFFMRNRENKRTGSEKLAAAGVTILTATMVHTLSRSMK